MQGTHLFTISKHLKKKKQRLSLTNMTVVQIDFVFQTGTIFLIKMLKNTCSCSWFIFRFSSMLNLPTPFIIPTPTLAHQNEVTCSYKNRYNSINSLSLASNTFSLSKRDIYHHHPHQHQSIYPSIYLDKDMLEWDLKIFNFTHPDNS